MSGKRPATILPKHFGLAGAWLDNYVREVEAACPSDIDPREFDAEFRIYLATTRRKSGQHAGMTLAEIITRVVTHAGHTAAANGLLATMARNFARDSYSPNRVSSKARRHNFEKRFVAAVATESTQDQAGEYEQVEPFASIEFGSAGLDGSGTAWERGQLMFHPACRTNHGAAAGSPDYWADAVDAPPMSRPARRCTTSKAGETGQLTGRGHSDSRPQVAVSESGRSFHGGISHGSLVRRWAERRRLPGLFASEFDDARNYQRYSTFARTVGADVLPPWRWALQRADKLPERGEHHAAHEIAAAFAACVHARRERQPCTVCGPVRAVGLAA